MSTALFVPDGVWIPKAIVAIASRYALPLYLEIRRHCYETPECFPGQRRLARLVGCSAGTISTLTDRFNTLGIIHKNHNGRHCVYRLAEDCWRRRKPRKSAHRSAHRTEDRSNFIASVERAPEPKKPEISRRSALDKRSQQRAESRAKRANLIKTVRRWVELSPHLPGDERPHRLGVLDRSEILLDDWWSRSPEDQRAFDLLVARARATPLDGAIVQSLRQQPRAPDSLGALLARQGWFRSGALDPGPPLFVHLEQPTPNDRHHLQGLQDKIPAAHGS